MRSTVLHAVQRACTHVHVMRTHAECTCTCAVCTCSAYASCLECAGATLHDSTIEQLVQLDVSSTGSVDFDPPPATARKRLVRVARTHRGLRCGAGSTNDLGRSRAELQAVVNGPRVRVVTWHEHTFRPRPGHSPAAAPRSKPAPEPSSPCVAPGSCRGTRSAARFRTCRCLWASYDKSTWDGLAQ